MQNLTYSIIVQISRYLIIFLFAFYVYGSFSSYLKSKEKAEKIYNRQLRIMFIIHFLSMLILFLHNSKAAYVWLYLGQMLFLFLMDLTFRATYKHISRSLLNMTNMLMMIGFVELSRLNTGYATRQLIFASVTCILCLLVPQFIDFFEFYTKLGIAYAVVGIAMLAAVYVFGTENYGAKNWISIKGIVFQPSEFVKIIYVFFLASFLSKFRDFKHVVIIGIMAAVHVGILVLEKDLGGALLFFITFLFMLFVATGKKRYLLAGFGGGAAASVVAYKMFSHVRIRVMAFIDPWSHIDNEGYQVTQSLFAIGTGGLLGMGFSEGAPEDIPVVASDFIFAAIAEEFGTFFGICLILLEICMFMMFVRISLSMRKVFYKLVALGLSIEYITQTLLNLGGVTKFLPSTGVTLPLISYGGSSIISTIFMIFIVQGMYILSMDQEEEEMKNEGRKEA